MSNGTQTVVLVHRNDIERTHLRQALESIPTVQIAGERHELRAGIALAHQVRPEILVLDLAGGGDDTLSAAAQYRLEHPDTAIFLSAEAFTPDVLVKAMRAGAQEVLKRPLDRSALTAAVERVAQINARKHGVGTTHSVITVFSNKGGIGVTTLATNLALSIRRRTGHQVALADFDYQSGDVAAMLGMAPERSMGELIPLEIGRVDSTAVQAVLMRHSSGVTMLPQPERIDEADGISGHLAGRTVEVLSSMHEIVVVDAPHFFNDVTLELFDRSSVILMVAELSILSVRASRRSLDIFQKLNYLATPDRVRLVVNRRAERSAISPMQVEETLGMPVSFYVSNDYAAVNESINLGKPLCTNDPLSRAGQDIDAIARQLVAGDAHAVAETEPQRRKVLGLFGRKSA